MTKERARANEPAMPRRTLLTALPATGAALALSAAAASREVDPLVPLYHEWLAARREWFRLAELPGNENFDDPRMIALERVEGEIEDKMLATAPVSTAGVAALVALAWCFSCNCSRTDPIERAQKVKLPENQALMAIWSFCTGKEGEPDTGQAIELLLRGDDP